jgi:hypothetical protein
MILFSQADDPLLWAPGVFASVSNRRAPVAAFRGGFYVYPTHYSEPDFGTALEPQAYTDRNLLWTFVGSVASYPAVRAPLVSLADKRALTRDTTNDTAEWNRRWTFSGNAACVRRGVLRNYADSLHSAKFVVCPRGVGTSSVRLFEAMRAGRAPVIISDEWLAPPLVDWESCAIQLRERDLHHLPAMLRERETDAGELGARARKIWEERYSPQTMLNTLVESCLDIAQAQRRLGLRLRMATRAAGRRSAVRELKVTVRRTVNPEVARDDDTLSQP